MDIDLPFYLFWAVVITGAISLLDLLWLRPARQRKAANAAKDTSSQPLIVEYSRSFFPVLLVVFLLRGFLAEPYQIPSSSMVPTLKVGDFILVSKYAYGLRMPVLKTKLLDVADPARGDVMVFVPPHDPRYFIKRVIGIPGDKVTYANKVLTINGEILPHKFVRDVEDVGRPRVSREFVETLDGVSYHIHKHRGSERPQTWQLGPGDYLMMGDNRDYSADSRTWGFASQENIVGKAVAVWAHKEPGWNLPTFAENRWLASAQR